MRACDICVCVYMSSVKFVKKESINVQLGLYIYIYFSTMNTK